MSWDGYRTGKTPIERFPGEFWNEEREHRPDNTPLLFYVKVPASHEHITKLLTHRETLVVIPKANGKVMIFLDATREVGDFLRRMGVRAMRLTETESDDRLGLELTNHRHYYTKRSRASQELLLHEVDQGEIFMDNFTHSQVLWLLEHGRPNDLFRLVEQNNYIANTLLNKITFDDWGVLNENIVLAAKYILKFFFQTVRTEWVYTDHHGPDEVVLKKQEFLQKIPDVKAEVLGVDAEGNEKVNVVSVRNQLFKVLSSMGLLNKRYIDLNLPNPEYQKDTGNKLNIYRGTLFDQPTLFHRLSTRFQQTCPLPMWHHIYRFFCSSDPYIFIFVMLLLSNAAKGYDSMGYALLLQGPKNSLKTAFMEVCSLMFHPVHRYTTSRPQTILGHFTVKLNDCLRFLGFDEIDAEVLRKNPDMTANFKSYLNSASLTDHRKYKGAKEVENHLSLVMITGDLPTGISTGDNGRRLCVCKGRAITDADSKRIIGFLNGNCPAKQRAKRFGGIELNDIDRYDGLASFLFSVFALDCSYTPSPYERPRSSALALYEDKNIRKEAKVDMHVRNCLHSGCWEEPEKVTAKSVSMPTNELSEAWESAHYAGLLWRYIMAVIEYLRFREAYEVEETLPDLSNLLTVNIWCSLTFHLNRMRVAIGAEEKEITMEYERLPLKHKEDQWDKDKKATEEMQNLWSNDIHLRKDTWKAVLSTLDCKGLEEYYSVVSQLRATDYDLQFPDGDSVIPLSYFGRGTKEEDVTTCFAHYPSHTVNSVENYLTECIELYSAYDSLQSNVYLVKSVPLLSSQTVVGDHGIASRSRTRKSTVAILPTIGFARLRIKGEDSRFYKEHGPIALEFNFAGNPFGEHLSIDYYFFNDIFNILTCESEDFGSIKEILAEATQRTLDNMDRLNDLEIGGIYRRVQRVWDDDMRAYNDGDFGSFPWTYGFNTAVPPAKIKLRLANSRKRKSPSE